MTVGELIEKLKTMDKNLPVVVYAGELAYSIALGEYGLKEVENIHLDTSDSGVNFVFISD